MKMLAKAIAIASNAFIDKLDKGSEPYILHCLWVMNAAGGSEDRRCAAILHDLVEDCPEWTMERLAAEGFNQRIMFLLSLLTHKKDDDYLTVYIPLIASDIDATEIKRRDLEHNTQITRLKGLRKKDHDRIQKYHTAYTYLKDI